MSRQKSRVIYTYFKSMKITWNKRRIEEKKIIEVIPDHLVYNRVLTLREKTELSVREIFVFLRHIKVTLKETWNAKNQIEQWRNIFHRIILQLQGNELDDIIAFFHSLYLWFYDSKYIFRIQQKGSETVDALKNISGKLVTDEVDSAAGLN